MRPKKVVLIVDSDEDRLGRMELLLKVRGYSVRRFEDVPVAREFLDAAPAYSVDALLVSAELLEAEELIERMSFGHPAMGTMLLGWDSDAWIQTQASAFLPRPICRPADILERLQVVVARKRGPRRVERPTEGQVKVAC